MEYRIVRDRDLGRFSDTEHVATMPAIDTRIVDLVLGARECLLWVIHNEHRYPSFAPGILGDLKKIPLAANYFATGSGDIRDKILVQNPLEMKGPYVLDRASDPTSTVFKHSTLQGFGKPAILKEHTAGDKIPSDRYLFIGKPSALFEELKARGYTFR